MLFNSFEFLLFLPIAFLLYWFVFQKNLKVQNAFLLLASYLFYGWWDWRFLGLIILSSAVDYWCGLKMEPVTSTIGEVPSSGQPSTDHRSPSRTDLRKAISSSDHVIAPARRGGRRHDETISPKGLPNPDVSTNQLSTVDRGQLTKRRDDQTISSKGLPNPDVSTDQLSTVDRGLLTKYRSPFEGRKRYLTISLIFNLGTLAFFKYFNFFIDSAAEFITLLGFQAHPSTLNLILPVGISFYTFQTMSYTIDVYRGKLEPTKDPIAFFTFVAFFPQLVAGPIERASNLLPQFFRKRQFQYQQGSDGMKLILWGLFKKMVIADNCALVVNPIFDNYQTASGLELIMGAILFAFQIYGDFSGYSDIAIGTAKLFGFELMTNFRTPYFSRDIAEFWRRWHISLSTWFRDYVYIPLGGSRVSTAKAIRNIFIVFLVSGFWHGANWTFIAWGGIHAALFIPIFLIGKNRAHLHEGEHLMPSSKEVFQIALTFLMVCIAWVFFRSETIGEAWGYLASMISNPVLPKSFAWFGHDLRMALILFLCLEWLGRFQFNWLERIQGKWYRYPAYLCTAFLIVFWGVFTEAKEFIYFQF